MAPYLLDTNHASPLVTLDHPLRARVVAAISHGDLFFVSTANLSEIMYGLATVKHASNSLRQWALLEREIGVLTLTPAQSKLAGLLQAEFRKEGIQLKNTDAQLAIQALHDELTLLTTDGDFRPIKHLKRASWFDG